MKLLKRIVLALLFIIALLLIIALFVPKEIHYEKTVMIDKPIEVVWEHTNSLADLDKWSPWMDYDPNMSRELTGTDGTVGAMTSWESDHEKVGKGSQIITKVEKPNLFATDLKFYQPYESEAKAYVKLTENGNKTNVAWGFESEIPYPFNLMNLYSNMDKAIGDDFGNGLAKLKNLCEN